MTDDMNNKKQTRPDQDQELGIENEELNAKEEEFVTQDADVNTNEFIDELQNRVVTAEEKYKRAMADYRNLERRVMEERKQYVKLANRNLVESLLEPLDFMETATKHIDDKGLQMVIQRFYQVLEMEGLEEIIVKSGDSFNEQTMEAVDTAEGEEGKVVEVRQKGFTLNGVVIRHARVTVGK